VSFVVAALFLLLLLAALGLNIFGLPGNWALLGLVGLWDWFHGFGFGAGFYVLLLALALSAEAAEFVSQFFGAKRYGATGKGNLGGLVGALAGAILGALFLFGIGALFGAVAGAFAGCYLFERSHGRSDAEARRAAMGAMYGKVFGLTAKIGLGAIMWVASVRQIWPA